MQIPRTPARAPNWESKTCKLKDLINKNQQFWVQEASGGLKIWNSQLRRRDEVSP